MKSFIKVISVILGILVCGETLRAQNKAETDFYTQIAQNEVEERISQPLESPVGETLSTDKQLKWGGTVRYRFKPMDKVDDREKMEKALHRIREEYACYLQDVAPKGVDVRKRQTISSMQFRYETKEDQEDFTRLLQGGGQWDSVPIPYYHGPQGPSVAWYRTELELSEELLSSSALMLHFNGADYYTDAFLNGHHVGYHEGMLDPFEFDVKRYARKGKNVLLIRLRNDYSLLGSEGRNRRWGHKLAASNSPGWDDPFTGWSCCPAGYGIYQTLYLETRSTPYLEDIFPQPDLKNKKIILHAEVEMSNGDEAGEFMLKYSVYGQNFTCCVVRDQWEKIEVVGGRVIQQIEIPVPGLRIWSPDNPWLYQVQVELYDITRKKRLDSRKRQFGMRSFEISATSTPKGRMLLNGEEIRLKGANTMGFFQLDVMRKDTARLIDDILLARLTNMNFIRTTQRTMPEEVYEYADRLGLLLQSDLPLFAYINHKQYSEILKQAGSIERLLRSHPSVILLSYLNESMAGKKPHAISRKAYERLFEALDVVVHHENPDRVVKYIDGDYQMPNGGFPDHHLYNIWYENHGISLDRMCRGDWMKVPVGWMYGCGEFGAEGLDFADVMRKYYPQEWLKTDSSGSWSPVNLIARHSKAQTWDRHWNWFETQKRMEDWVEESQDHQAWGVAKVARAFRRMPRMNSFAVHLFIDAWPNGWMKAIMDCERNPKKAWFAYRDALTPLAVQIESERSVFYAEEEYPFQVWICNDSPHTPDAELRYVMEYEGKTMDSGCCDAVIPSVGDGSAFQGFLRVKLPAVDRRSVVRVRVGLFSRSTGKQLHEDRISCTVFPRLPVQDTGPVYVLGESDNEKEIRNAFQSGTRCNKGEIRPEHIILISDIKNYMQRREEVDEAVGQGAKAVFLRDALTEATELCGSHVEPDRSEGRSWTLFRNVSHRWVHQSGSTDLKYSFDLSAGTPKRYTFTTLRASGFVPVLTFKEQLVVAERSCGRGQVILLSLDVVGRLTTNPILGNILNSIMKRTNQ